MRNFIIFIAFLMSTLCYAQDTIKVLFVGNSFTSQNNLPDLFLQLSEGSGKNVLVASHMPGGLSVGDISQGTSAHMNNPIVYSLIKSNNWDFLVLQDNQGRFCLGYGQFPSSSLVIEGHLKIRDSLLYYHPCAHMIWFAGFGPKNGYPPYGNTGAALIDSIYQNYQFLLDTAGQVIAPIGPAFKRIMLSYPTINLWSSDEIHPSLYGSYLTANVLYTTVFKSNPLNSSYNPGISSSVDSLLKITGYQTTLDSLNFTGLSEITPIISQSGNTLTVSGYQNCNWFYNGVPHVSVNCTINMNQSGNYYTIVTDQNNCVIQTFEQPFSVFNGIDNSITSYNYQIFPNPADDFLFFISSISNINNLEIKIYNVMGNIVKSAIIEQNQYIINVGDLNNGVYIIFFNSNGISENIKLLIQR